MDYERLMIGWDPSFQKDLEDLRDLSYGTTSTDRSQKRFWLMSKLDDPELSQVRYDAIRPVLEIYGQAQDEYSEADSIQEGEASSDGQRTPPLNKKGTVKLQRRLLAATDVLAFCESGFKVCAPALVSNFLEGTVISDLKLEKGEGSTFKADYHLNKIKKLEEEALGQDSKTQWDMIEKYLQGGQEIKEQDSMIVGESEKMMDLLSILKDKGSLIEIDSKVELNNEEKLGQVYTPGVAACCQKIMETPEEVENLTNVMNSCLVVTDSSGWEGYDPATNFEWVQNITIPTLESECLYYKMAANIDAYPLVFDHLQTKSAIDIFETLGYLSVYYRAVRLVGVSQERIEGLRTLLKGENSTLNCLLISDQEEEVVRTYLTENWMLETLTVRQVVACLIRVGLDNRVYGFMETEDILEALENFRLVNNPENHNFVSTCHLLNEFGRKFGVGYVIEEPKVEETEDFEVIQGDSEGQNKNEEIEVKTVNEEDEKVEDEEEEGYDENQNEGEGDEEAETVHEESEDKKEGDEASQQDVDDQQEQEGRSEGEIKEQEGDEENEEEREGEEETLEVGDDKLLENDAPESENTQRDGLTEDNGEEEQEEVAEEKEGAEQEEISGNEENMDQENEDLQKESQESEENKEVKEEDDDKEEEVLKIAENEQSQSETKLQEISKDSNLPISSQSKDQAQEEPLLQSEKKSSTPDQEPPFRDSISFVKNYIMYKRELLSPADPSNPDSFFNEGEHSIQENSIAMHRVYRGLIKAVSKLGINNLQDLDLALSSQNISKISSIIRTFPDTVKLLTIKGSYTALITDSSSVLGLGRLPGSASIPVLEGLSVLLTEFGQVNALPLIIEESDPSKFQTIVKRISPIFGSISLEDISSPNCFNIEQNLRRELDVSVFHNDQHGTATAVLAALINSFDIVDKPLEQCKIVVCGCGAAGVAVVKILLHYGFFDIVVLDSKGVLYQGRPEGMTDIKSDIAKLTNPRKLEEGGLDQAIEGASVYIGLTSGGILTKEQIQSMERDPIVIALSNPTPEIGYKEALEAGAKVVCTGQSGFPNQVSNSLVLGGLFSALNSYNKSVVIEDVQVQIAEALANLVTRSDLDKGTVLPHIYGQEVWRTVRTVVKEFLEGKKPLDSMKRIN